MDEYHDDVLAALAQLGYDQTCSTSRPTNGGICLAINRDHAIKAIESKKNLAVVVDINFDYRWMVPDVHVVPMIYPRWGFALFHNALAGNRMPPRIIKYGQNRIHETAVIGTPGCRYIKGPNGEVIEMAHVGGVVIKRGVSIGPLSVVHRALLDDTVIEDNVKIGSACTIGHGSVTGSGSILTVRVSTGGSSTMGERCWCGMGAIILPKVRICNDVLVAAGAVVTKNIDQPGIYAGVPAEYKRPWDGTW